MMSMSTGWKMYEKQVKRVRKVSFSSLTCAQNYQKSNIQYLVSVYPRFIFDNFNENDYSKLLTYESERNAASSVIVATCKQYRFEGIVLEVWSQLGGRVEDSHILQLVTDIGKLNHLHSPFLF